MYNLFILLIPFGEVITAELFGIRIRLLDICAFLLLFHLTIPALRKNPFLLLGGALLFSALVAITSMSFASSAYLIRTLIYLLLFSVITSKKPSMKAMGISYVIAITIGVVQYFFYPNLRPLLYLGYDPHIGRLAAPFMDPNIAGGYFAMASITLLYVSFHRVMKYSLFTLSIILVFLTYSRISIAALLLGLFLYLLMNKKWLFMSIIAIIIGLGIALVIPRSSEGSGTDFLRTNSVYAKIESAQLLRKGNILTGRGFNIINNTASGRNNSRHGIDNSFFTLYYTAGIIGVGAFLYSLYRLCKTRVAIPLIGVFAVHCMSVNTLFIPSLFSWWMLLFSLILFYTSAYIPSSSRSPPHQSQ